LQQVFNFWIVAAGDEVGDQHANKNKL